MVVGEVAFNPLEVTADRVGQGQTSVVQQRSDLVEGKAESPQGKDPVEPPDVLFGVEAVPAPSPLARHEQAKLVVVMQRANRHTRRSCKLTHLPALVVRGAHKN